MSVIPRLRSNRQGIFEFPSSCHSGLFLYSVTPAYSSILSLRPIPLFCHSGLFFICHSGLRAGVQVNIDSLAAWIPGQARNDRYISVIPRLRSNRQGIFEFPSSCHSGLRAGVQVNIDSLTAWIPGQARNDSKKNKPGMTKGNKKNSQTL